MMKTGFFLALLVLFECSVARGQNLTQYDWRIGGLSEPIDEEDLLQKFGRPDSVQHNPDPNPAYDCDSLYYYQGITFGTYGMNGRGALLEEINFTAIAKLNKKAPLIEFNRHPLSCATKEKTFRRWFPQADAPWTSPHTYFLKSSGGDMCNFVFARGRLVSVGFGMD